MFHVCSLAQSKFNWYSLRFIPVVFKHAVEYIADNKSVAYHRVYSDRRYRVWTSAVWRAIL